MSVGGLQGERSSFALSRVQETLNCGASGPAAPPSLALSRPCRGAALAATPGRSSSGATSSAWRLQRLAI